MSLIKANTIKPVTAGADLSLQGDSGGSAVDCLNITSAGDVDFSGNTDAKIKLPSAGGIYESDGTTAILTESGGAVTLDNVTLGSSVTGIAELGTWASASFDTIYRATDGDLFVTGYLSASGICGAILYSDSSTPPSVIRVRQEANIGHYQHISVVIRKNDYWKITVENGSGVALWVIRLN